LECLGITTKVIERLEIAVSTINIFWGAIIWFIALFITRFGQPQGETTLKKLKRIVEKG
jgi:hypothetical protein